METLVILKKPQLWHGFSTRALCFVLSTVAFCCSGVGARPNILLITADDMNYDTPGYAGGKVPDITPNLDRLASQGIYFKFAHVTVAVCQPSRSAIMTGRYPHRNGAVGFNAIFADC